MKFSKVGVILTILLTITASGIFGQSPETQSGTTGMITGGIGFSFIENDDGEMETWYTVSFAPEIAFGKFGIGLGLNLLINNDGEIREKDLKFANFIRYLRYGQKRQPLYVRLGQLDYATIGHGFIMHHYNNSIIDGHKRIGLQFDMDFENYGFETVVSNLGKAEIFGGRVYYRPLKDVTAIPIIKDITFGASLIADISDDASMYDENVYVYGGDIELPIINTDMWNTYLYFDYAKISDFGSGIAYGIQNNINLLDGSLLMLHAKFERRDLGKEFQASYFDNLYQVQRKYPFIMESLVSDSTYVAYAYKYNGLQLIKKETHGYFGELGLDILGQVKVSGGYEWYDTEDSGVFTAQGEVPDIPKIKLKAYYTRENIDDFGDLFKLDENSLTEVDVGYKMNPFMTLYMAYSWTYKYNEKERKYDTIEKVVPKVEFSYSF